MTDTTDPRALGEEVARIQQTFDDANAANDDTAWEAARTYLVAWFAIHGGSAAILDALRHRFVSPQTAGEVGTLIEVLDARANGHSTIYNDYSLFAKARDTIASLTAERDALVDRVAKLDAECEQRVSACQIAQEQAMQNGESAAQARAERDAALERCEVMRGTLEPFAKAAEAFLKEAQVLLEAPSEKWPNFYIVARDLHRARAALGSGGGG